MFLIDTNGLVAGELLNDTKTIPHLRTPSYCIPSESSAMKHFEYHSIRETLSTPTRRAIPEMHGYVNT